MNKITLLFLYLLSSSIFSQRLDKSKHNLKKKDLNVVMQNSAYSEDTEEDTRDSFKENLFVDFVVKPIVFVVKVAAFEVFVQSVFERTGKHPYMKLTPHPYLDTLRGDYTFESSTYKPTRWDISNQFVLGSGNMKGNNLTANFRFLKRVSIAYNQLYLHESTKDKNAHLFMHDLTANYYRIRTKSFSLYYGLGANWVHSGINKAYFMYNTGAEYFFKFPLSISLEHKGTPLNDVGISQTKATLNIHKNKYALKAGVHFYNFGGVNSTLFAVGGKIYL